MLPKALAEGGGPCRKPRGRGHLMLRSSGTAARHAHRHAGRERPSKCVYVCACQWSRTSRDTSRSDLDGSVLRNNVYAKDKYLVPAVNWASSRPSCGLIPWQGLIPAFFSKRYCKCPPLSHRVGGHSRAQGAAALASRMSKTPCTSVEKVGWCRLVLASTGKHFKFPGLLLKSRLSKHPKI